MLKDLVNNKHTAYYQSFPDWESAIQAGCEVLLADNTITQDYVDAIIKCIKEYGPYIVIAPMIAMPHSTEGAVGVNDTKISFMKVEQPVRFQVDNPETDARLFFTIASVDHEKHLQNIMNLSEMLMNEQVVEALLQATCDEDLIRIHNQYL
jgi:ascorbate PTS system EIIA or EIIAB component